MTQAVSTASGEYSVLEVALPGRSPEPAGVILVDPSTGELGLRMRRDWDQIASEDEIDVLELIEDDLRGKASEMGAQGFLAWLEDCLSNLIRISDRRSVIIGRFEATLNRLYSQQVPTTVAPFRTHLPVYSLRAAAGKFCDNLRDIEEEGWVEVPPGLRLTREMFVATVIGRSMEPRISDGSRCVFRSGVAGSREGKLVLVEDRRRSEASGLRYTVKKYHSRKQSLPDGSWRHAEIVLEPLNPEFEPLEVTPEQQEDVRVVAEFVRLLD